DANESELLEVMAPLGIHYRSQRLKALGRELTDRFSQRIPTSREELRSLPGVGDYTASSVLCQAYGQNQPMIDVIAGRAYGRLYGQQFRTERQTLRFAKRAAEAVLVLAPARQTNLAVLDFAQDICTPVPRCSACDLRSCCRYLRSRAPTAAPTPSRGRSAELG